MIFKIAVVVVAEFCTSTDVLITLMVVLMTWGHQNVVVGRINGID